jgi:hypothetical protein
MAHCLVVRQDHVVGRYGASSDGHEGPEKWGSVGIEL